MFRSISSSIHADTTTPADPLNAVAISSNGNGLPQKPDGSASAMSLFEACSVFTRVSACMVAGSPKVTRYTRVLQQICYLLHRSGCFRPSDRFAGRDSHPLEIADFPRRTRFAGMSEIHFEYHEGDWLGWACAAGALGLLLLGAGMLLWLLFRRR